MNTLTALQQPQVNQKLVSERRRSLKVGVFSSLLDALMTGYRAICWRCQKVPNCFSSSSFAENVWRIPIIAPSHFALCESDQPHRDTPATRETSRKCHYRANPFCGRPFVDLFCHRVPAPDPRRRVSCLMIVSRDIATSTQWGSRHPRLFHTRRPFFAVSRWCELLATLTI